MHERGIMKHHRKNKKRVLNVRVLWLAILAFWSFSQRTHALEVSISRYYDTVATEYPAPFSATVSEDSILSFWNWGDGDVTTNRLSTHHGYESTGVYSVLFVAFDTVSMELAFAQTNITVVEASTHYVSPTGSRETPYTSWETATPVIQEAIDAAETLPGTLILVTNGLYDQGNAIDPFDPWNSIPASSRVLLNKPVMLRSVNGPEHTTIEGSLAETNLRCVYLGAGACLSGFTTQHGNVPNHYGGGIFCEAYNVIIDCVIKSNMAESGGGVYGGTLYDCLLQTNRAVGYAGGGAYESTLYRCRLIDNTASIGGAAFCSTLYDCYGHGNSAGYWGGPLLIQLSTYDCSIFFSETQEPHGCDYHLSSFSPCINRGDNSQVIGAVDLDGHARIQGGIVDMGAFEYAWDAAQIPTDWLSSYGLNTNGSADQADTDGDGFSNRQEWRAGTDPTNATSFLYLLAANEVGSSVSSNGGFIVRWASRQGISYKLLRCYSLNKPLAVIASNIVGQATQTTYTDLTISNTVFYRVAVE